MSNALTEFIDTYGTVVLFPAIVLHELTHAVVATPWVKEQSVTVKPRAAQWDVTWADGVAAWQVALVALAPFVAGMLAFGVGMAVWLLNGFTMPTTVIELSSLAVFGMWWAVYVRPSPEDVHLAVYGASEE